MAPEFGVQPTASCSVQTNVLYVGQELLTVQPAADPEDDAVLTFDVDLSSSVASCQRPWPGREVVVFLVRGPDRYWGATLRVPKEGTVGEWDIDMDVYSEYEGYFRAPGRCRLVDGATLECGIVEEGVDGELYMEGTFAFRRVGDDRKAVACDELLEWCLMQGGASL